MPGFGRMRKFIKHLRQPFQFIVTCAVCGLSSGLIALTIGVPLLICFGNNLRSNNIWNKLPAWIGIIITVFGVMVFVMGSTLCIYLYHLFKLHEKRVMKQVWNTPGPPIQAINACSPEQPCPVSASSPFLLNSPDLPESSEQQLLSKSNII